LIPPNFVDQSSSRTKLLAFIKNPKWPRPPLDHRSVMDGPKKSRKLCVSGMIISFQIMSIFHFRRLCLKMPLSAQFVEFCLGGGGRRRIVKFVKSHNPQKARPWPEKHILAYIAVKTVEKCDLGR